MGLSGLRAEHRAIIDQLDRTRGGDSGSLAGLGGLIRRHLAREEEDLLPRLVSLLPRDTGPVAVILEEHRAIEAFLEELELASDPELVARLGNLLVNHVAKEEELLYPFAEEHLAPGDLAALADGSISGPSTS